MSELYLRCAVVVQHQLIETFVVPGKVCLLTCKRECNPRHNLLRKDLVVEVVC
jgi:hypothetical protein